MSRAARRVGPALVAAGLLAGAAAAGAEPLGLQAGAAVAPIALRAGMPLAGWLRSPPAAADGARDSLDARALVLAGPAGGPRVGLLVLDLFLIWPELHASVSRAAAELRLDALLLVATHTQSGPGGYADGPAAEPLGLGRHQPEAEQAVLAAALQALRDAAAALEPARLGAAEAAAPGISRNAERPDGPVDERVPIVRVDADEGDALATVFAFSAAPAVLSESNRSFSGDYPRHARRRLEAVRGGVALFLPGALADQAPLRGGLERRRGDVAFEVEAAAEIGNALGLVVAARVPLVAVQAAPRFGLRTAALALPPPRPFAGCPFAPLARLGRGLADDADWRTRLFGREPGPSAPVVALRLGELRFVFSPFAPSAALAGRLREAGGPDIHPVAHAGGWLGDAHAGGEPPPRGDAPCRHLFGPELGEVWLATASEALAPLR